MYKRVLLHVVTSHSFGLQGIMGIREAIMRRMKFFTVSWDLMINVLISNVTRVSTQWCSVVICMQMGYSQDCGS